MQLGKACFGSLFTNSRQFTKHNGLESFSGRTTGLTLKGARLEFIDIVVTFGISTLQQNLFVLQQFGTWCDIANAKGEASILYEKRRNLKIEQKKTHIKLFTI